MVLRSQLASAPGSVGLSGARGFHFMPSVVKNPLANSRVTGDAGLSSSSERFPGGGNGNPFQYSCQDNPWTEEPVGLQSMESQRVRHA